jgi:hypothetical protein
VAGTQHGFNNDTTPRYERTAAALAGQRTVEFFNKNLRGEAKDSRAAARDAWYDPCRR